LRPITEDWDIKTITRPGGIEWVKKPSINLGFFNIPVASLIEPMIVSRQKELSAELDSRIANDLNIKSYVKDAWLKMQAPILLSKDQNAWLKINPQELVLKPFNGQGKNYSAVLILNGFTETIIGEIPENKLSYHLPKININKAAEYNDHFEIALTTEISHEEATKLAKKELINKTFTYQNGKKKVTITDLHLYGRGENIVIKAEVEGNLKGYVFLHGEPYYDEEKQAITLRNLDFDLHTRNKLHRTASWLLHGKFVKELQNAVQLPLAKEINEAKQLVEKSFSNVELSKGIRMETNLISIKPDEFFITSESFVAVIKAIGTARVKAEKK
jgi:hypothetical protein